MRYNCILILAQCRAAFTREVQLLSKPNDEIMTVTRNQPSGESVTEEFNFLWAAFGRQEGQGAVVGEAVPVEPVTAAGQITNAAQRKSVLLSLITCSPSHVSQQRCLRAGMPLLFFLPCTFLVRMTHVFVCGAFVWQLKGRSPW
jgi:hypothetical protein